MSKHLEFINTPVSNILEEAISSTSGIGSGIETFPLGDYIMHSVFLKMTGFQEQKMKCIAWEMATEDFDYRRTLLYDANYGEYSNYTSKSAIYSELIKLIQKLKNDFDFSSINLGMFLNESVDFVKSSFKDTNISKMKEREFDFFCNFISSDLNKFLKEEQVCPNPQTGQKSYSLFQNLLKKFYDEILYTQRNRLAHNTLSYQQNLPTLNLILDKKYDQRNYFIFFTVLILIDKIFINLFHMYLNLLDVSIN